jgi:copper oxidase (laccase) domain-containing protein
VDAYICMCHNGWEGESCNIVTRKKTIEESFIEKEARIQQYYEKQEKAAKDPRKELFLKEMDYYQNRQDCTTAGITYISLSTCCSGKILLLFH